MAYVPLKNGLRIQVLPDTSCLPECQRHHFSAFIREPFRLVVWDDDPNHLLSRAQGIEDQLMNMIWKSEGDENEKPATALPVQTSSFTPSIREKERFSQDGNSTELLTEPRRKAVLIQPILTACTLILILAAIGSGWRQIAMEVKVDQRWTRLAFLAVVPVQIWLALV